MRIRVIIAAVLFGCFVWIAILNWAVVWIGLVRKQRAPSWIPLLGGLLGLISMNVAPWHIAHSYSWLPLVLDYGTAPGLTLALVWHVLKRPH